MDFNKILDSIGHFGLFQKCVFVLVCIIQLLVGIHMLANVFLMAEPNHRCYIPNCDSSNTSYDETFVSFAIPKVTEENGMTRISQCEKFDETVNVTGLCSSFLFTNETISCGNFYKWDSADFEETVISEFDIVCENSWSGALSQSWFMAGGLFGAAGFGFIADRFGRKPVILIASVVLFVSSVCTALSKSFIMFSALRFVTSAAINGLFTTAYIIGVEFIGTSKRLLCANVVQVIFAVGELLLTLLAYYERRWKGLQLAISLPTVILLGYYWLLPESVRWLIAKNKLQQAKEIILKAAKWNRRSVSDQLLPELENMNSVDPVLIVKPLGPLVLFGPQLRIWSLTLFFIWIVNAMVYYGISLSAANLGGNAYTNFAILSAVEIPSVLLATVILHYCGRRRVLCAIMVFGGLACGGTAVIPGDLLWLSNLFAVLGKGAIAASFAIIYIYSAEILPTPVRSTGVGISSTFARLGSITAPLINELRNTYKPLPMIVFAVASILAGIAALILPETHNQPLPETLQDVEKLRRRSTKAYEVISGVNQLSPPEEFSENHRLLPNSS